MLIVRQGERVYLVFKIHDKLLRLRMIVYGLALISSEIFILANEQILVFMSSFTDPFVWKRDILFTVIMVLVDLFVHGELVLF